MSDMDGHSLHPLASCARHDLRDDNILHTTEPYQPERRSETAGWGMLDCLPITAMRPINRRGLLFPSLLKYPKPLLC